MPHLDNDRRAAWDRLRRAVERVQRQIDAELRSEWAIPVAWYEVLHGLRESGGSTRPLDLAARLDLPASTLSRRVDRLAEEGWVRRVPESDASDLRAVDIEITESGRRLWREMNVSYRRVVQREFAQRLDDQSIQEVVRLATALLGTDESTLLAVDDRDCDEQQTGESDPHRTWGKPG